MRQYSERWRLINDSPAMGDWNMAADEALMLSIGADEAPPTLRFYRWSPACLSMGYGQRVKAVDRGRLQDYGVGIVRRPTGGGAILHADELTYSVVLPIGHALAKGSVVESYRQISRALAEGLRLLDVALQPAMLAEAIPQTVVCFETPSHYEPTVGGRKLIGSAQARKHNALLQHGSIPLRGDIAHICEVLAYDTEELREQARRNVQLRACTLTDATGGHIKTYDEVANALVQGFETVFDLSFERTALTKNELGYSERLVAEKYGQENWTARR